MWFGVLSYFLLLTFSVTFFFFMLKGLYSSYYLKFKIMDFFFNFYIIIFLYFIFFINLFLYDVFLYFKDFFFLFKLINLNINLISVYYFPFFFIFFFITFLSLLFCLNYNKGEMLAFSLFCSIIFIAGFFIFFTNSIILFFFAYELLLIPSFFILYRFAKTRKCIESAYLMFFWTQFGALFLILSFIYLFLITGSLDFYVISLFEFSKFEVNFLFFCWIIGFGVKLPIWPFYGWLPKAHVEASTNFSIFLSGVLVKFAFFALMRCLFTLQIEPTFLFIYPFLFIGILDSGFKLFYQIDLKKLVAYSTVVEMHWLTISVLGGYSVLFLSGFSMLISHALLSTSFFIIVDSISRRFKSRLITEISGINFLTPKLFLIILINSLIFLGFPGSIFFISEFLFFTFFFDLIPFMSLILYIILYLLTPSFFFKSWFNTMFSSTINFKKKIPLDLDSRELTLFVFLILFMFWLGFFWSLFIF